MIDWASIPIHLRCKDRKEIDPRYPGDHLFWKYHEFGPGGGETWKVRGDKDLQLNETHERAYQLILKRGKMRRADFRKELGITDSAVESILMALSFKYPIYQEEHGPQTFVGVLT